MSLQKAVYPAGCARAAPGLKIERRPPLLSALDEGEKARVDHVDMGGKYAVRVVLAGLNRNALRQLNLEQAGIRVGNDLVVVAW